MTNNCHSDYAMEVFDLSSPVMRADHLVPYLLHHQETREIVCKGCVPAFVTETG